MQIGSSDVSKVMGNRPGKTGAVNKNQPRINDSFKASSKKKEPEIIDLKKAAEAISKTDSQKYNVLWNFKPEPVQRFKKDNPEIRKMYEELGGKLLQDYLDSIGKPYMSESTVKSDPVLCKDGNIILSTNHGKLYSLSPEGKEKLICEVPLDEYQSADKLSQAPDGAIFFTKSRDLHRLDPKTGEIKKFESVKGRPGIYYSIGKSGTIYQGTWNKREQNYLYAMDSDDNVKWKYPIDKDGIRGSALEAPDGKIHFNTFGGRQVILSADGKEVSNVKMGGEEEYTATWEPVLSPGGEKIYTASKEGSVFCCSAKDGKKLWEKKIGPDHVEHIAVDKDGNVYAARMKGTLVSLNPDGSERWQRNLGGDLMTPPSIGSNGSLYQVSGDGVLHCLSKEGGTNWKAKLTGNYAPAPLIGKDDVIYLKTEKGSVQAIKNKTLKEMAQKAKEEGKCEDGIPTIEIGEGFVTIGGVKIKRGKN